MQRILLSGAAGRVGRVLRKGLAAPDRILRVTDIAPLGEAAEHEEVLVGDARKLDFMVEALQGVDAFISLAAYPEEAPWETIFPLNYELTYAGFEAARIAGVKRVIFASSVQAVGFHPLAKTIDLDARARPSGFYGVSKAFGEALGSLYADKYGLSVGCVRIASFEDKPQDVRMLSTWLSHDDCIHLFDRCIRAPDHHYYRVFGVSKNTRARVDNSDVDWLGYRPQSDAEDHLDEVLAHGEKIGWLAGGTHGGGACQVGFAGDLAARLKD
jgi:uronate dehydrogenase